jgi:hypothetical protein
MRKSSAVFISRLPFLLPAEGWDDTALVTGAIAA